MKHAIHITLTAALMAGWLSAGAIPSPGAIDIGSRLELFVDRFLVEELRGAQLRLHEPRPAGIALAFDKPWEGAFLGYVTVLQDGPLCRM